MMISKVENIPAVTLAFHWGVETGAYRQAMKKGNMTQPDAYARPTPIVCSTHAATPDIKLIIVSGTL